MKTFAILTAVTALIALGAGQASARTTAPASKTVVVAMHDPGCHWFAVDGKFLRSLTVTGPVKLANYDEKTLLIAGPAGVTKDKVGRVVSLTPGVYHITMVGQAPDDNHLKLVVH